jgi:chemosensory pili system protein ChpA (sensor histidine kinase/response regulator)
VELGVNHYLGKPYSEEELLALIGRYVAQAAEVQPLH